MKIYNIDIDKEKIYYKSFEHVKINDNINNDIKSWKAYIPVFISAQTGAGKSHFILDGLVDYMKNLAILYQPTNYTLNGIATPSIRFTLSNEGMLILSNRLANNTQFKKDLCKKLDIDDDNLEDRFCFKNVYICTYQNFEKISKQIPIYSIRFVVLDEAHFFIQDSTFNPDTYHILDMILKKFIFAVRIYMSATFDNSMHYIYEEEKKYFVRLKTISNKIENWFTDEFRYCTKSILNYGISVSVINYAINDAIWLKFCNDENFRKDTLSRIKVILDNHQLSTNYEQYCCQYLIHKLHNYDEVNSFVETYGNMFFANKTNKQKYILSIGLIQYFLFTFNSTLISKSTYDIIKEKAILFMLLERSESVRWVIYKSFPLRYFIAPNRDFFRQNAIIYDFKREFKNYNICAFEDYDTIIEHIISNKTDDKWLIFVDKSNSGINLEEKLNKKNISCKFLNSKIIHSKNDKINAKNTIAEIINHKSFNETVLIVTSALDSGITIFDTKLKHIVLPICDKISFMQMIGRKRFLLEEKNEKVTLYIPIYDSKKINGRIQTLKNKSESIQYYKNNPIKSLNHYFDREASDIKNVFRKVHVSKANGKQHTINLTIEPNPFAEYKIEQDIEFYSNLKNIPVSNNKLRYIAIVQSWLYIEQNDNIIIKVSCKEQIENLIHEWQLLNKIESKSLTLDEFEQFFNDFSKLYDQQLYGNFHSDKKNNRILQNINNAFTKMCIPYKFKKSKNLYILESTDP